MSAIVILIYVAFLAVVYWALVWSIEGKNPIVIRYLDLTGWRALAFYVIAAIALIIATPYFLFMEIFFPSKLGAPYD